MDSANHSLQSFTRKIQLMMVYRTALKWTGVWVMIMGVIVLVVRFTGALPPNWWLFAFLSLVPLIGAAWFVEYQRRPSGSTTTLCVPLRTWKAVLVLPIMNPAGALGAAVCRGWAPDPAQAPGGHRLWPPLGSVTAPSHHLVPGTCSGRCGQVWWTRENNRGREQQAELRRR